MIGSCGSVHNGIVHEVADELADDDCDLRVPTFMRPRVDGV